MFECLKSQSVSEKRKARAEKVRQCRVMSEWYCRLLYQPVLLLAKTLDYESVKNAVREYAILINRLTHSKLWALTHNGARNALSFSFFVTEILPGVRLTLEFLHDLSLISIHSNENGNRLAHFFGEKVYFSLNF